MDLVDIDKVLDNLELNEEEHKDDIPAIKHLQILSSDNNMSPADVITSDAATSANVASYDIDNGSSATTTNATGDRVNRFVGVSQVFSSLDDYRKIVESLEAGMQLYKPNVTKDNDTHIENFNIQDDDEVVDPHMGHANFMQRNDEESDEAYGDEKINKFACTDEEHGFSSNSITTSSSSTFSSGPSPGLLSTESESSFDVKLWDKSLMLHKKCDDDGSTQQLNDHDHVQRDAAHKSNCSLEPQRSEFDELAVGLSSISLTNQDSLLPSKITCSKTTTTNYLNSEEEESRQEPKEQIEAGDLKIFKNMGQANNSQQDVMVTFGSTMDEISDTELDSILQEIDAGMSLQQASSEIDRGKSTTACDTIKNKLDREVNISNEENIASAGLAPISCDVVCDDAINIDSFSQASTIEFSEDHIHEDEIENNYKSMEEICDGDCDNKKNIAGQKRQRPTTLDLPVRKVNLYATAGQTPPGSRIYDQATSSSDEDTPEGGQGGIAQLDDEQINFNDAAGHTPPERPDRTIVSDDTYAPIEETVPRDTASNFDEPMAMPAIADVENQISTLSLRSEVHPNVGKFKPTWVPDHEANACMQCQHKFTLLKRRHHCRACGHVLCSVCCSQKFKLEFLSSTESRVCVQCFLVLTKRQQEIEQQTTATETSTANIPPVLRTPNPNNPMEYCSTIPPHRQVNTQSMSNPTVIVPVGVLKKEGNLKTSRKRKSVMFSDGIRPGSDLASLDGKWSDAKHARKSVPSTHFTTDNAGCTPNVSNSKTIGKKGSNKKAMPFFDAHDSFLQKDGNSLPLICITNKSEQVYQEVPNNADLIKRLHTETLKFAVQTNFYVIVKISHLKCCINKTVINFTTCGLHHVGNDEIIILLELDNSNQIPKDIFVHLNEIYVEASKGHPITEFGFSMPKDLQFLGSREHGGFLFIRSTFQCLQDVHVPIAPFLIGVLIHRWEVPWAKIFPLRLMLRLGAQYRYYPSPHISVREREPVYAEIAQTIINLLADFRNYTYTLPTIKGMYIHMEDRRTNILIPRNRHDEVIKAINNSSDHILAIGANFSKKADGHLVCIQNMKSESTDSHSYSTQAINIQGQPRKVTGASFFVLNEALKTTSGLSGKCSIIEDGLMVQILPSKMVDIRNALINMKDIDIVCGPIEAGEKQTEVVYIQWVDADVEINIGVKSPIDSKEMDGIPSIRVHSGNNLSNSNHIIQWTEVFIIEISDESSLKQSTQTAVVSNIAEQIAKNTSVALLPFLDLLAANGNVKIGLRVTLNQDNVCYEAGSQNEKLPPLYMNALDNELIQTLHKQANEIGKTMVLELIFHILNV